VPAQPDCFVQNRIAAPPTVGSQHTLLPPYLAQSAAPVHARNMFVVGHWPCSTHVLMQQTAAPSACEQLVVFAQVAPTG